MSGWAKGLLGHGVARVAVSVVALLFLGAFAVLQQVGAVEPGRGVAVVGVASFVVVATPVALLAGRAADRSLGRHD